MKPFQKLVGSILSSSVLLMPYNPALSSMGSLQTVSSIVVADSNLIDVIHKPSDAKLKELGLESWSTWEKEVSTFKYSYDLDEMIYVLKGKFTVTPDGEAPVSFIAGDIGTFRKGLKCTWDITSDVKKLYKESIPSTDAPTNLIEVIHKPSQSKLKELDVASWDSWEKEVSTFKSNKKRDEMFYVLKGKFTVTPEGGTPISFNEGDLATFRKGLKCTWDVTSDVKKVYKEL